MRGSHCDGLIVAVSTRMIVGPGDRSRVLIIKHVSGRIRFGMFGVEEMRAAYAAQSAQRNPQVLMIASRQNAATALAKARDPLTIRHTQPVAGIDREQPQ